MTTFFPTPLLTEASHALALSQTDFGRLFGVTARTIQRWQGGATVMLSPNNVEVLVRAVHPKDAGLAARIAQAGGTSLAALGVGAPPRAPTLRHLVDSMVCAAADAMDVLPNAVRPALVAAFGRAYEMGLAIETVQAELTPRPAAKPKTGRSPAKA